MKRTSPTGRAAVLLALLVALAGCDVATAPPPGATAAAPAARSATTPAATPFPATPAPDLLAQARAARAIGDEQAAANALSALLQQHPTSAEAGPARLLLAESFATRGNWASAAELLRPLAAGPADSPLTAPAIFWLARAHESAGEHADAVSLYERYRALETPIAPYAAMREAALLVALGRPEEAAAAYAAAAAAPIARGERAAAYERAIAQLRAAGRGPDALALYADLLAFAAEPAYRARLLAEAAALADELGDAERARAWRLAIVADAPASPQAVAVADALLAAGDPTMAAETAGRIYFAAQRWADAARLLEAASAAEPDPERGAGLRRLRGLALRNLGDYPNALALLSEAGALSPNSDQGRQAQLDWVQTVGQSGDTERAIQGYSEFAVAYPDDPRAPEALERAIVLRERLGDTEGAFQDRLALGAAYPSSSQGQAALHQAGLALFNAGRYAEARAAYQALADGNRGYERARGAFWAARAASAGGDEAGADELFATAREAAPASYYGARAAEELEIVPQGTLGLGAPLADADWAALDAWVAAWAGPTAAAETDYARRALLLDEVGLRAEASAEWVAALAAAEANPPALLALARAAADADETYAALGAAERLLRLAPADAPAAPAMLDRLRFPTPYADLVIHEAAERGLDPRLLYALFRQESLFNPAATSWVGARGLAQVMPETGQGIAQNLGVTDFNLDDLYRPVVSVRFGAFYLGRRIADMSGSVHGALAAYNGGLGNSIRWAGGNSVADPDLFTESIDYPETQGYVKAVYGFWGVYQGMYSP